MYFWRKMEKISCTDRVGDEEVLPTVKEYREISYLQIIEGRPNGLVT
jgi:hypothetical protein